MHTLGEFGGFPDEFGSEEGVIVFFFFSYKDVNFGEVPWILDWKRRAVGQSDELILNKV